MKKKPPPKFFLRFFKWFCDPELHPFIEGDLLELYRERLKATSLKKAKRRFALDVLLLFRPGIIRPLTAIHFIDHLINNYNIFRIRNWVTTEIRSFMCLINTRLFLIKPRLFELNYSNMPISIKLLSPPICRLI